MHSVIGVLDPDVVGDFDSGGFVPGPPLTPVRGAGRVARQLLAALGGSGARFEVATINAEPGVVVRVAGAVAAVIWMDVRGGRVAVIHGVGNPDKLDHLEA